MAPQLYPWVADVITICHAINFPFKGNVMFGGEPTHTLEKAFSVVSTSRKRKHPFNFLALIPNQKIQKDLRDALRVSVFTGFPLTIPCQIASY